MKALLKRRLIILFPIVIFAYFLAFSEDESITKTEIANAEKLIGLGLEDAERDSMLDALNEQLEKLWQKISLEDPPKELPYPRGRIALMMRFMQRLACMMR